MSQSENILKYLKDGKSLNPIDALNIFGCFRLGARVNDLRKEGHDIKTDIIQRNGKRFASYTLIGGPAQREMFARENQYG